MDITHFMLQAKAKGPLHAYKDDLKVQNCQGVYDELSGFHIEFRKGASTDSRNI